MSDLAEVRSAIEKMSPSFKAALPPHVSVEKFVRVTLTALQTTPALLEADRRSLYAAATKAAQMGLLPDGREGAIVTYRGKTGVQCQWMPMVAGVMKLVRNSGEISTWSVQAVYENDVFEFELGDTERILHKPALKNRGSIIAVYSVVTMKDGEKSREVMSVEDVEAIRKRSRSGTAGPWVTDFAEMAKKTVIRRHAKRLPLSTDIDGVVHEDDEIFMPPPAPTEAAPDTAQPKRPSRLAKVAAAAAPTAAELADDDGVIDVQDVSESAQIVEEEDHDSPI